MIKYSIIMSLQLCFMLLGFNLMAQNESDRKSNFNLEKEYAIQGYDPVAYFTESKAVKGSKNFQTNYKGIPYLFSSEKNKDTFLKTPEKYEPQYGGWCAYAMGLDGSKVKVDPETFKITDGKLYLFYNFFFNNTLKDWNTDEANLKKKADQNWKNTY
ncbi:YHS domain-containing (seleno)protein [Chondrinema litorale]|uniref:YHS domain-containing (seleno)protein n=1 Tax=Chondrinema litorale TaxID=2994555 RepID=UPI00254393A4|nr:YHS domain-containing (seleno)protein [Chondrinema litorale]UZR97271.1 YHS domain-containing protein [Chondrinema litorale]